MLAVCLAVATIVLAYYTVQTTLALANREFEMIYYEVAVIDHSDIAWTLQEPDPYILEALQDEGLSVCARRNETNFIDQVREHGDVWDIVYNGTYYHVVCMGSCDPHPSPDLWILPEFYPISDKRVVETQVIAADVSVGAVWVVWMIGWRKMKSGSVHGEKGEQL